MIKMAIFKANFAKNRRAAKAAIRYIENRPGKDNRRTTRPLWGSDGNLERGQVYQMIDGAEEGSIFFRFVVSPDPAKEDTHKDLFLREIIEQTMLSLEDRLNRQVEWVAATHADHAPHRHVHILAILPRRLQVPDLQAIRTSATEASLTQRHQLDLTREQQEQEQKEHAWER